MENYMNISNVLQCRMIEHTEQAVDGVIAVPIEVSAANERDLKGLTYSK